MMFPKPSLQTGRFSMLMLIAVLAACAPNAPEGAEHAHGEDAAEHAEAAQGPHGGRWLEQDGYAVELAIFEQGTPPQFRAWLFRGDRLLTPQAGTLEIVLTRLGGTSETHTFSPQADYLAGNGVVREPHSFDVEIKAQIGAKTLRWTYPSYEGRTTIPAAIAEQAGVRVAKAGSGTIRDEHEVQGLVTPIEGRHARIVARFPGPLREVRVGVGDRVRTGQTLAVVESNISLSTYAVAAPFAGTILARHVATGDLAGEAPLFELADLSNLWVDLHLFGSDAQHITAGLPVEVVRLGDGFVANTALERVLPGTATASQSTIARARIDNADGQWRPGAAVRARVTVAEQGADLVVPVSALQKFRDWDVVFVRVGDVYEARPLQLGRRDARVVEVLDGLHAGDEVVVEQSYLIKADIEKSGAAHDH